MFATATCAAVVRRMCARAPVRFPRSVRRAHARVFRCCLRGYRAIPACLGNGVPGYIHILYEARHAYLGREIVANSTLAAAGHRPCARAPDLQLAMVNIRFPTVAHAVGCWVAVESFVFCASAAALFQREIAAVDASKRIEIALCYCASRPWERLTRPSATLLDTSEKQGIAVLRSLLRLSNRVETNAHPGGLILMQRAKTLVQYGTVRRYRYQCIPSNGEM